MRKKKEEDKRYMRFGRRVFYDTSEPSGPRLAAKRYMRFGRKLPDDFWARSEDELSADKRYMRFGKRSVPESVQTENHQPDVMLNSAVNSAVKRSKRNTQSVPSNQQTFISSTNEKLPETLGVAEDEGNFRTDSKNREKMSVAVYQSV